MLVKAELKQMLWFTKKPLTHSNSLIMFMVNLWFSSLLTSYQTPDSPQGWRDSSHDLKSSEQQDEKQK